MSSQAQENASPMNRPVPMQLQPDFKYTIYCGAGIENKVADIFVLAEGTTIKLGLKEYTGGPGGTEFWFYAAAGIAGFVNAQALTMVAAPVSSEKNYHPDDPNLATFQSVANSGQPWSQQPHEYQTSFPIALLESYSFWSTPLQGSEASWGVEFCFSTTLPEMIVSLFGVQWYRHDPNAKSFSGTMEEADGFTGTWTRGQTWPSSSPNPYSGPGYFAKRSL